MHPEDLELCILEACQRSLRGEWSGTIGALGDALREISGSEPPDAGLVAEAIAELDRQGQVEARKYETAVPIRLEQAASAERFFFRGDFRLKLTYAGRKRLADLPQPEPPKEKIGF